MLTSHVDALLTKIRRKYKEYGINEKPFVIVKSDDGSHGMGVMTVRDVKDLEALDRRARSKATRRQGRPGAGELIVQEGVLTNERVHDGVAEPVVYMMDRYVVGGFYRVHAERGTDENLNLPGASFVPLAFSESAHLPQPGRQAGRERTEPLLHVRRDRPAGDGGGELRARSHRPGRRSLRMISASAELAGVRAAQNSDPIATQTERAEGARRPSGRTSARRAASRRTPSFSPTPCPPPNPPPPR